jgi:hypothetical protein
MLRHRERDRVYDEDRTDVYESPTDVYDRVRAWTPAVIPVGLTIALVGVWVLFVPLVGSYFDFGFHTDDTWQFGQAHWTLSIAPGLAAAIAGILMILPSRLGGWILGLVAALAGVWLVVGPSLYPLWTDQAAVEPVGGSETMTALMWVGYYYGPGALILLLTGLYAGLLTRRRRSRTRVVEPTRVEEPVIVDEPRTAEPRTVERERPILRAP